MNHSGRRSRDLNAQAGNQVADINVNLQDANCQGHPVHMKTSELAKSSQRPVVQFDTISGGAMEVVIEHAGQSYLLRTTKNGRLLLNK